MNAKHKKVTENFSHFLKTNFLLLPFYMLLLTFDAGDDDDDDVGMNMNMNIQRIVLEDKTWEM